LCSSSAICAECNTHNTCQASNKYANASKRSDCHAYATSWAECNTDAYQTAWTDTYSHPSGATDSDAYA
jgi:hypothetical protein